MTSVSWVDLREKLPDVVVVGGGMDGAGDPTMVDGVAACSHFSVSSLMLDDPPGDLPADDVDDFLVSPMGSSLGRSLELFLEYFLSPPAPHPLLLLGLSVWSWTMLDRLEEPESVVSGTPPAAASALELRRLQLNDLTVEAMLS